LCCRVGWAYAALAWMATPNLHYGVECEGELAGAGLVAARKRASPSSSLDLTCVSLRRGRLEVGEALVCMLRRQDFMSSCGTFSLALVSLLRR